MQVTMMNKTSILPLVGKPVSSLPLFKGNLHKPLSAFERKTICQKFRSPDVDALYTHTLDAYLSRLVPGVKTVDKDFARQRAFLYNCTNMMLNFLLRGCLEDVKTGTNSISSLSPNLGVVPKTR